MRYQYGGDEAPLTGAANRMRQWWCLVTYGSAVYWWFGNGCLWGEARGGAVAAAKGSQSSRRSTHPNLFITTTAGPAEHRLGWTAGGESAADDEEDRRQPAASPVSPSHCSLLSALLPLPQAAVLLASRGCASADRVSTAFSIQPVYPFLSLLLYNAVTLSSVRLPRVHRDHVIIHHLHRRLPHNPHLIPPVPRRAQR